MYQYSNKKGSQAKLTTILGNLLALISPSVILYHIFLLTICTNSDFDIDNYHIEGRISFNLICFFSCIKNVKICCCHNVFTCLALLT